MRFYYYYCFYFIIVLFYFIIVLLFSRLVSLSFGEGWGEEKKISLLTKERRRTEALAEHVVPIKKRTPA